MPYFFLGIPKWEKCNAAGFREYCTECRTIELVWFGPSPRRRRCVWGKVVHSALAGLFGGLSLVEGVELVAHSDWSESKTHARYGAIFFKHEDFALGETLDESFKEAFWHRKVCGISSGAVDTT